MMHRFTSPLPVLAHTCSDFGSYMMKLQSRSLKRDSNGDCEGGPTVDEARLDYRRMIDATKWPF